MNDNKTISHPAEPMRVGSLVRWPQYPDKLYYIVEMNIKHCNHTNYCKIEDITHTYRVFLPITELVLDDVDYNEI